MFRSSSGDCKNSEKLDESTLSKEIALNHRHEEILAKRELLLQNRKSLMSSKTDQVHVILGDWHKAKERNEQLVRVVIGFYLTMCYPRRWKSNRTIFGSFLKGQKMAAVIEELDEIHHGLQRAMHTSDDATFVGMRDSYWKMVEEEHPQWLAGNKSRRSPSKHKTKR